MWGAGNRKTSCRACIIRGGTKTIPLCGECHAKVHDISNGERRNQLRELTKNSLTKRKELIKSQGGFYSKSGRWVTKIGRDKGVDLTKASRASSLSKKERRLNGSKNLLQLNLHTSKLLKEQHGNKCWRN